MSAGCSGAVIEIAGTGVLVVMVFIFVRMVMSMFTLMDMHMAVRAAIGMLMIMRMRVIVAMGVAMSRSVLVNVGMFVRTFRHRALDLHFTRTATTYCAHAIRSYSISISLTRISIPPVGCT